MRCSRIHFSLHLTCPREGQGQVSDPVCTESCECLFWNDNWSERAGNCRASKITPPRSQGGAHRVKVQLPLPAHLGTVSPFPSDLVLGFQSECGERSALGCWVPKEDRSLRCLMVWAVVLVKSLAFAGLRSLNTDLSPPMGQGLPQELSSIWVNADRPCSPGVSVLAGGRP